MDEAEEQRLLDAWETYCRGAHQRRLAEKRDRDAGLVIPTDRPWWIAQSNINCERRATQGLQDLGFQVWWPTKLVPVKNRHMKRPELREFPAVAGLLLVRHPNERAWPAMIGVDGLREVVQFSDGPQLARASKVQEWRDYIGGVRLPTVEDVYRIGRRVHIVDGPFASFDATVEMLTGCDRLKVYADIFGRPTLVELELGQIEVI